MVSTPKIDDETATLTNTWLEDRKERDGGRATNAIVLLYSFISRTQQQKQAFQCRPCC